jgi:hypothetical protein
MSKRWSVALIGLVCFLAGTVVSQNLPLAFGQGAAKAPVWLHGLDLKARKGGELEFKDARKYGVEVFKDENNGNLVYISETGSIAVIPGK